MASEVPSWLFLNMLHNPYDFDPKCSYTMHEVKMYNNETSNPLVEVKDFVYTCTMSAEQMCFQYPLPRLVGGCLCTS